MRLSDLPPNTPGRDLLLRLQDQADKMPADTFQDSMLLLLAEHVERLERRLEALEPVQVRCDNGSTFSGTSERDVARGVSYPVPPAAPKSLGQIAYEAYQLLEPGRQPIPWQQASEQAFWEFAAKAVVAAAKPTHMELVSLADSKHVAELDAIPRCPLHGKGCVAYRD